MIRVNHFLFCLFILLFYTNMEAQNADSTFPLGVYSHIADDTPSSTSIQLIEGAGMNYIVDNINTITGGTNFNLMGHRKAEEGQWIFYYTKGYYKRWEAEKDSIDTVHTGFKHPLGPNKTYLYGSRETHPVTGEICWATDANTGLKVDSVLWGPNYHQDKNYSLDANKGRVEYTAAYKLSLKYYPPMQMTDTVCALLIVYRYKWWINNNDWGIKTDTLASRYLTVGEFPQSNAFKTFNLVYQYPENRYGNKDIRELSENMYPGNDTTFIDTRYLTGIEFRLDWYGIGKLYIDYVDLYDNLIGKDLQDEETFENIVKPDLITYANSFSNYQNISYWYINDEPNTIDSYEPMRIVDSIVTTLASFQRPTITEIYPMWNGYLNGDNHLKKFMVLTGQKQLMIDKFPFNDVTTVETSLERLRESFRYAHRAQPGFWYSGVIK